MIKIANIAIIDTGYISTTSVSGTQAPELANSGSVINLKGVSMSFQRGGNLDTSPIINSNEGPALGFGSVTASQIVVRGILDGRNSTDMDLMNSLNDLAKTYGVKLLYYSDTTDGYRDITDSLGTKNSDDVHKANNFSDVSTPHLHVRISNFSIQQSANSLLRYTLTMIETE